MTKKCNNCDNTDCGDVNKPPLSVPFVVHESMMARTRKTGGDSGYVKCNMCNGTGRHKKGKRKK